MDVSPVMKQYTRMPQHAVSPTADTRAATWPPQVSVSATPLARLCPAIAPATRQTIDTTTAANEMSSPIRPNVDM